MQAPPYRLPHWPKAEPGHRPGGHLTGRCRAGHPDGSGESQPCGYDRRPM